MQDRLKRRRPTASALALLLPLTVAAGCGPERGAAREDIPPALPGFDLGEVELRGPSGTGEPHLFAPADGAPADGPVLLSWLEPRRSGGWALRLAQRRDGSWSAGRTVAERDAFFVNWADFPSVSRLADGTLLVHWLEKVADDPYAYHVLLSLSRDGGDSWSDPVVPHRDRSPTEHGFVSVVPWGEGAALVWLDGREMDAGPASAGGLGESDAAAGAGGPATGDRVAAGPATGGHGDMTLRFTTISPEGVLGEEILLDDRTCECCTTALARTRDGLVVAYRDRGPEEVRDIYTARYERGRWSEPRPVHADGWRIPGCPVNGPQLSTDGDRVAIAWFTAPDDEPRVLAAFSGDGGATWGAPVRVDEGLPLGRVDVELLPDGTAAVAWIEAAGEEAGVLLRRVGPDGGLGPPARVAETSAARASGFPRMARAGEELLLAWTLPAPEGGIRVRTVRPATPGRVARRGASDRTARREPADRMSSSR